MQYKHTYKIVLLLTSYSQSPSGQWFPYFFLIASYVFVFFINVTVNVTIKLVSHPCIVVLWEVRKECNSPFAKPFIRTVLFNHTLVTTSRHDLSLHIEAMCMGGVQRGDIKTVNVGFFFTISKT